MTTSKMKIGPFDVELTHVAVRRDAPIALCRVADLERHVDRAALLAADDPAEPPYWAHLWSGSVVLAAAVPAGVRTVLELGCGLGLPGLVAARDGARVTFVDRATTALAFVRASAAANGIARVDLVAADACTPALAGRFELVLAAELLYDRGTLGALADAVVRRLAPGGRALLADAGRVDTGAFYAALDATGVRWWARAVPVREEGLPVTVRLVEIAAP